MKTDSTCLFCTQEQLCVTHAAKQRKTKKSSAPSLKVQESTPTVTPTLSTDTSDDWLIATTPSRFKSKIVEEKTQDELRFREAVRNLYPILSKSDRKKYADLVDPPKTSHLSKAKSDVRRMLNENDR